MQLKSKVFDKLRLIKEKSKQNNFISELNPLLKDLSETEKEIIGSDVINKKDEFVKEY